MHNTEDFLHSVSIYELARILICRPVSGFDSFILNWLEGFVTPSYTANGQNKFLGLASSPDPESIVTLAKAFLCLWITSERAGLALSVQDWLRVGRSGDRVWFSAGAGNYSHHRVQTGTAAHPASYPMGTRGSYPGGKVAEAWSWPLTSI
jgi:hypothetical protein